MSGIAVSSWFCCWWLVIYDFVSQLWWKVNTWHCKYLFTIQHIAKCWWCDIWARTGSCLTKQLILSYFTYCFPKQTLFVFESQSYAKIQHSLWLHFFYSVKWPLFQLSGHTIQDLGHICLGMAPYHIFSVFHLSIFEFLVFWFLHDCLVHTHRQVGFQSQHKSQGLGSSSLRILHSGSLTLDYLHSF